MEMNIKIHGKRKGVSRFVDEEFLRILNEIKKTRLILEKDTFNSLTADWRITLAMSRHPLMMKIKDDVINAELHNNNKRK